MSCEVCQGTGMTRSGFLDCMAPGCDAAERRAKFNDRLKAQGLLPSAAAQLDIVWRAYQMGLSDRKGKARGG